MRRIRVIPVLLVSHGSLVKTKQFRDPVYVGDPINAVRIFNEKEVDEIVILDVTPMSADHRPPFQLLEQLATECFMPLSFGGGVTRVDDVEALIRLGVEKVILRTQPLLDPDFVPSVAARCGNQSIIVAVDVRRSFWGKRRLIGRARYESSVDPVRYCQDQEESGAGELLVTSVEREGTMGGYDIPLLHDISSHVSLPVIANGGAGSIAHMVEGVNVGGASAVAASSMFVFHKQRNAVMISFPPPETLVRELFAIC